MHGWYLLVVGDLAYIEPLRGWGGWGNAAAIVLFLMTTVYSVLRGMTETPVSGSPPRALDLGEGAPSDRPTEATTDVPDLQLPS